MEPAETIQGLCSTCEGSPTCGWRQQDPARVVHHCEEFLFRPPRTDPSARAAAARPSADPAIRFEKGRDRGLCLNCENWNDCRFPIPEGGVWRCEEYR